MKGGEQDEEGGEGDAESAPVASHGRTRFREIETHSACPPTGPPCPYRTQSTQNFTPERTTQPIERKWWYAA